MEPRTTSRDGRGTAAVACVVAVLLLSAQLSLPARSAAGGACAPVGVSGASRGSLGGTGDSGASGATTCCPRESRVERADADSEGPGSDPCCPGTCERCSLLCCGGLAIASIAASSNGVDRLSARARDLPRPRLSSTDPDRVFHPPRS